MKKFFVSVGLIAAGTASLHAAYAPDWNSKSASMWSVSGTLRGFYDDNYETAPNGAGKTGSLGFEVSPQVALNVPLQQTELGIRYIYGLYYYQEREHLGENPIDQTHQLDLWVDHAFTERWQARVQDSFVIGQEPELLDPGTPYPRRVNGNNISNTGTIALHTDWTRLFSTELGYQNSIYAYQNSGYTIADPDPTTIGFNPTPPPLLVITHFGAPGTVDNSLAGLLNRIEQSAWLNLQWRVRPETMVQVGGRFGLVNYTGDEPVAYFSPFPYNKSTSIIYTSSDRDSRSYIGYLGFQHAFLPNLSMSGQAGIQYSESYNDPLSSPMLAPYVVMSAVYTYAPGSYAQIGFTQSQESTDVIAPDTQGRITQSAESSTVYGSINQKLTPKLLGTVIGRWQHSIYNQGFYNNQGSDYYTLGVNLSYSFTTHFSGEAGYNMDDVHSQVPGQGYTRNRVYLGVSAAY
jgi:hypothetical protein